MKKQIIDDINNISKIKVTNFKDIPNEEFVTKLTLLAAAEFLDKYNCGFLPFKLSIAGLHNMLSTSINFLDDDNINFYSMLNKMIKLSNEINTFSSCYEELLDEIEENDIDWHLIFTKTFIKIRLYQEIIMKQKK